MQHPVKLLTYPITRRNDRSRGYILITLMLFMTLLTMAALAVLPEIVQQIQRDREEEMVHRGTEYMRAIKKYYKKFGRYPTRIEELENTNQQRFLRKRYKDPLATKGDKDFKVIRQGDPALNMLGLGGMQGLNQPSGKQMPSLPGVAANTNTPMATGLSGPQISPGTQKPTGPDAENSETSVDAKSASSSSDSGPAPGGQVFGGGPILGVASTSKAKTIREFNKKNHYNDWLFIYDPNADRGGLLKGPVQPDSTKSAGINQNGAQPTVPGQSLTTPQPAGQQPSQPQPPDEQ